MRIIPIVCLAGGLSLLGGCFDNDNNHPGKDSDPSKPSLQMQPPQPPTTEPSPETRPQKQ